MQETICLYVALGSFTLALYMTATSEGRKGLPGALESALIAAVLLFWPVALPAMLAGWMATGWRFLREEAGNA